MDTFYTESNGVSSSGRVFFEANSALRNFPVIVVCILLLIAFLLRGMVWISAIALSWLQFAAEIAFGMCLFVLLPLCIFRKTRRGRILDSIWLLSCSASFCWLLFAWD
jgi:hypothetical protein